MKATTSILISLMAALGAAGFNANAAPEPLRRIVSLDGTWQIAEGKMEQPPAAFDRTVPVPGLVDMALPAFEEVGVKSARREAFWYRRTFNLDTPIPAVAVLKIHKAMFTSRVYLNGKLLGDQPHSFTPGYFDARPALREGENELTVRVGAGLDAVPAGVVSGKDNEKSRYIPGIYDCVELILSGSPQILNLQTVPDIDKQSVTVHVRVRHSGLPVDTRVKFIVREAVSGQAAGEAECVLSAAGEGAERSGQATVALRNCRLWSPEDPFLYDVEARSGTDALGTRFGMRSFRFDHATGRAILNGKPYFMRGSNVCILRFSEDPQHGGRPWDESWVRHLHRQFRDMHWNSLRYCIGFPPELWYRIADEEGFLIQDEYPIWDPEAVRVKSGELVKEYSEWMEERRNHPCVVIWDAQNESMGDETGAAIRAVRGLDLSKRPWDNGWGLPQDPDDSFETHPYLFWPPGRVRQLGELNTVFPGGNPSLVPSTGGPNANTGNNPIILNEYGSVWINRDGTPTSLGRPFYDRVLGKDATPQQRRHLYARIMAAKTEYWRSHRKLAALLHFCGLGYSRPDGATSDNFIDVEQLVWEPEFYRYVRDAFAPVGLMLDFWAEELPASDKRAVAIVVINDLYGPWQGKVRLRLLRGPETLAEQTQPCELAPLGDKRLTFDFAAPAEPGRYQLEATLVKEGATDVRSLRDFTVLTAAEIAERDGIASGCRVVASSNKAEVGATCPEAAVDGDPGTRWSSAFADPQWLAIDLGRDATISRVELRWEAAYAKSYSIQVSKDGKQWQDVYQTDGGKGGVETVRFRPVTARWVRFFGTRRATIYGYSLWEFRVFPETKQKPS